MQINSFADLEVWRRGHKLTLAIYQLTRQFPSEERFDVISQLRRSASSICANIAEGQRKSTGDFIRYLDIALGSLEEFKYHLILSRDLEHCSFSKFKTLHGESCEISKMITTIIRKLRGKTRN